MNAASRELDEPPTQSLLRDLTAGYRPLPGVPDEFMGIDGRAKAGWSRFLGALSTLAPEEIESRFGDADRHIRDTGVSYRAHGETSERLWPLSHVPLLITADEWRQIEAGVEQRARLLELTLADIYGPARLVTEGVLPGAAITGGPDFLPQLRGVAPPGGKFLHFLAVDLGRGPDGRWWVLGDRTQAPSGSGYALLNRLVLSRAFPALYRDMNVQRLAPFFQSLRSGLASIAERADPRICLWTPGPLSQTYFEQAYLARYLGLLLVEGGDLSMRGGQIHIRTIAGLKRADVLWRRIDSDFADPLELNSQSQLGVAGLVEALRQGGVVVANALGSGILETPALLGFMPSIARRLLGQDLLLPNVATWWCGQPNARDAVLCNLDNMALAGAFGNAVLDRPPGQTVLGAALDAGERARLVDGIRTRGAEFIGQEVVHLSTTPVLENGHLTPRPFVLRVFATATADGWKIMPGGFARISDQIDARAVSMGEGVLSADVWVLAEGPVAMTTLLPTDDNIRIRRKMGNLPSRAADNLFWFGRYLERAESALRLLRCLAGRLLDTDSAAQPGIDRLKDIFRSTGAVPFGAAKSISPLLLAVTALRSRKDIGSAWSTVQAAGGAAAMIRERLSTDTWRSIARLKTLLGAESPHALTESGVYEIADEALQVLASISGLAKENMNRAAGWRFLDAGRRIERGVTACRFARAFANANSPAGDLDILLELVDSQITYHSRYLTGVALAPVRDITLLDPFNPRSLAFQVELLIEHIGSLPVLNDDGMLEPTQRLLAKLAADVAAADAFEINGETILGFERSMMGLADAIAARYFLQGGRVVQADKMSGLA